ncbi:MAG: serine/threonine protein kinase [Polyangiaceae bacterium]|nr:serine/threonine protein kinase [Polyangiaceae bacterium]
MGVVYKCKRKVFDRAAALKILRSDLAKNTEALDRFATEAKAASGIGNDHIVDVFDFGEVPDGSTYFAMEYLEGETLGARLAKGRIEPEAVVDLGRQLAEGLAAAHVGQIVHRDLKPDNVFITLRDGREFIKILDFGIAKVIGIDNKITRAGAVFGTPHYMSPEQCRGSGVDHRTDIYSLGIILFEMTVGRVPFDAENPLTILSMHLNEAPQRFADAAPDLRVPPGLENLVLKCLAKRPEERFASMLEVERALAAIARGEEVEIEVPISVAPPEPEEPAALAVPPAPGAPRLDAPPASGPVSVREPASDPGRFSFPGDVRASLPDVRSSAVSVPSSVDPVEAELRRAAEAADAERDWARSGRPRRWPFVLGAVALFGVAGAIWVVVSLQVETLGEAFQPARSLVFGKYIDDRGPSAAEEAKVALVLSPIDSHVFLEGRDLGTMPVEVPVKKGQKLEVEVKRQGYWSRKVTLDAENPKVTVRLAPSTQAKGAAGKGLPDKPGAGDPAPEAPAPAAPAAPAPDKEE